MPILAHMPYGWVRVGTVVRLTTNGTQGVVDKISLRHERDQNPLVRIMWIDGIPTEYFLNAYIGVEIISL